MIANPPLTIESFLEVSEQLPIDDQYELLNRLSDRLHGGCREDESEITLSPEWMEEINRRIAEVESGTAELIPAGPQAPTQEEFLRILSKVPNNPPDPGDEW